MLAYKGMPNPQLNLLGMFGIQPPAQAPGPVSRAGALSRQWLFPPFSVFDARQAAWQDRKRRWVAMGLRSEVGRGAGKLYGNQRQLSDLLADDGTPVDTAAWGDDLAAVAGGGPAAIAPGAAGAASGTSIFDPVLCELLYQWFCPAGGTVLDPFAGGSVRGAVAAATGRYYLGVELRSEQVEANRTQWANGLGANWPKAHPPAWVQGDSRDIATLGAEADFILSCPPYGDLERYSDDPADLSTLGWEEFAVAHGAIITAACKFLRPGRFAAWVVGNYRDPAGNLCDLVGATTAAFTAGGCSLYNDAILLTPVGTLPVRAGRQFAAGRKLGRTHQAVVVFCKGNWREAAAACGGMGPDPLVGAVTV